MPKLKESLNDRVKRLEKVYDALLDELGARREAERLTRRAWELRQVDISELEKAHVATLTASAKSSKAYVTWNNAARKQDSLIEKANAAKPHYVGKTHADYFNKRF